ncbi:hypothetical protein LHJ74_20350 [Streptomyces sp. N2-109]|uniref:Uncharacterized protein n=1 Tax=Streptomyces gossypii TaxID=2883101 RepID=A0ABT2JY78_9ACTN|nr:hypothetical protein [Streptomyces gossypii]MCT2592224.1 hypothetical protein [Streptomyces gossypii]
MSPKFFQMAGYVLVLMGIGQLIALDTPTWLSVWNIIMGVAAIAFASANKAKE